MPQILPVRWLNLCMFETESLIIIKFIEKKIVYLNLFPLKLKSGYLNKMSILVFTFSLFLRILEYSSF